MNKADDIICHAPGDKCHGCDHYHGKAPECKYKGERTMDERASDEYHSILLTYIRELNKAHKGIRRLVRRNRKLEAALNAERESHNLAVEIYSKDPHRFSDRPCSTCNRISQATSTDFGCVKYRRNRQ